MLLIAVIAYLACTVLIGFVAMRWVKNSADFVNANRQLPLLLSSAALFALWFGSETLFGATSSFLEKGILGIIEDPLGGFLCLVLFGGFFARRLYRMNLLTLGDLYRNAYGQKVELVAAAFMLLTFFGYIAAQLVALGLLLQLLAGISLMHGILISTLVVTLYTLAGGMWAISITDFAQGIIIVAGLVWAAWLLVGDAGGWSKLASQTPAAHFRVFPEANAHDWWHYLAAWMTLGLGSIPSQDVFQRMNASKSEKVAVHSFYWGGLVYLCVAIIPLVIVMATRVLYPQILQGDMQQVLPKVMLAHMPLGVQVLFFGALLSAIFSTCSGAILAPASILSENLIKPLWPKKFSDKQFLLLLRFSVILMAAAGCGMALMRNNIFELVGEASVLGLVTLLVPMCVATFWPSAAHALPAMLAMIFGFISWLIAAYWVQTHFPALLWGFGTSTLAYLLGYLYICQAVRTKKSAPKDA